MIRSHCIMTSLQTLPFWTQLPTLSGLVKLPHTQPPPLTVTSFIVHEIGMSVSMRTPQKVHLKFYSKFYVGCEIEFVSLGLIYKERFNKSLTTIIPLFKGYIGA